MQHRPLGNSGFDVPRLSLGSWQTFERLDEAVAFDVLAAAVEADIVFLDDARYDDHSARSPLRTGYSEVLFGNLLRRGGWVRDRFFIANKLWFTR